MQFLCKISLCIQTFTLKIISTAKTRNKNNYTGQKAAFKKNVDLTLRQLQQAFDQLKITEHSKFSCINMIKIN